MVYLCLMTCVWAFSFSLIGVYLAGQVDPWFSGFSRVTVALCVFLPFLRWRSIPQTLLLRLVIIGAVQIGAMYGFYYQSFLYLTVPEVLLFTVMTPVYITLLNDCISRQFRPRYLLVAVVAVLGAIAIRYNTLSGDYWFGLLLVQGANLSFAAGQVFYKRITRPDGFTHRHSFAWFFVGAWVVTLVTMMMFGNWQKLPTTQTQWGILLYLGLVASGGGYFLWNKGVSQVSVATTAVMNNVLIPAGLVVNLILWNRSVEWGSLLVGTICIGAALALCYWFDKPSDA